VPVDTSRMADDCLGSTAYGVSDLTANYVLRGQADTPGVINRPRLIAEHHEPLRNVRAAIRRRDRGADRT
jgi:hypothetical protein